MIWIRSGLKIFEVAAYAAGTGYVVVVIDVTLRTLHGCVSAREGKAERTVIKGRGRPCGSVVALLAGLRESARHVVGIVRALKIFKVAGNTIR